MTLAAIAISVLSQICLVAGQIMLKHALNASNRPEGAAREVVLKFGMAIGMMTAWFFLWLGLLRDWDLSHVYPFEGLSPLLLVLGAWIFLNERVSPRAWAGVALIGLGVALVSQG